MRLLYILPISVRFRGQCCSNTGLRRAASAKRLSRDGTGSAHDWPVSSLSACYGPDQRLVEAGPVRMASFRAAMPCVVHRRRVAGSCDALIPATGLPVPSRIFGGVGPHVARSGPKLARDRPIWANLRASVKIGLRPNSPKFREGMGRPVAGA